MGGFSRPSGNWSHLASHSRLHNTWPIPVDLESFLSPGTTLCNVDFLYYSYLFLVVCFPCQYQRMFVTSIKYKPSHKSTYICKQSNLLSIQYLFQHCHALLHYVSTTLHILYVVCCQALACTLSVCLYLVSYMSVSVLPCKIVSEYTENYRSPCKCQHTWPTKLILVLNSSSSSKP